MGIATKHIGLADKFAVSASTICAVHCIGLPFLLSVFLRTLFRPGIYIIVNIIFVSVYHLIGVEHPKFFVLSFLYL